MKAIIEIITRHLAPSARIVALLLAATAAGRVWGATATNPVTGETETYVNSFTGGTSADWATAANWDTSARPFISGGAYSSALLDGNNVSAEANKAVTSSTTIDGWNLQLGFYNGITATLSSLGKLQGDTDFWISVDSTSKVTFNGWGGGNWGGKNLSLNMNYYVASENGVTYAADISGASNNYGLTLNYYLTGDGSVSYQDIDIGTHVIKQADVTMSGKKAKSLKNKTLVTFGSGSTASFSASATIKVKNSSGTVLGSTTLSSITATTPTISTASPVGTCELVKTSTGIVLYWIDGIYNGADQLRVLGDDVTICSAATSLNVSGFANTTTGTIVFNTPAGCSAGDKLLFTKLEMASGSQSGSNSYATTITLTDTATGKSYTSGNVISTSGATIGNISASETKLTYNFPNVEVKAGNSYNLTFNIPTGYTGVRYRVENSSSGYVISSPVGSGWRPYGVITATKVLSSSPEVGSTILLSNTASDGTLHQTENSTKECNFAVTIPASSGLPNGTVLKVTRINYGSYGGTYSAMRDPYGLNLNAKTSLNLKGNSTYSSNTNPGEFSLSNATIQANATTSAYLLSYEFSDDCNLTVGTTYDAATGNSDRATAGKGVTFLHYNGTQVIGSSVDQARVRYVTTDQSGIFSTTTVPGYTPVYELYAEVVSIPDGHAATISSSPASWADIAWDVALTGDTSEEDAVLHVTGDATIALSSVELNKLTLDVSEGVTLTLTGSITVADQIRVTGDGAVDMTGLTVTGIFSGDGTVVFDYAGANTTLPSTTAAGFVTKSTKDNEAWAGTLWLKNYNSISKASMGLYPHYWCNGDSKLKLTNVYGYMPGMNNAGTWQLDYDGSVLGELVLEDDGDNLAYTRNDGFSHDASHNSYCMFSKLSGSGTLADSKDQTVYFVFNDAADFEGSFALSKNTTVVIGSRSPSETTNNGKIVVDSGKVAEVAAGKTWAATAGIAVNGSLTLMPTATLSGTVTGSGTIVCNQTDLSGSGYDNTSGWSGMVQIVGDASVVPTTTFDETTYGNANSTLEIVSGAVAITSATSLPGTVNVASGATLYLSNTEITSLAIAGSNKGTINLQMLDALSSLTLDIGTSRGTVVLPSSLTSLAVNATELLSEDGQITLNIGSGYTGATTVTLTNQNGNTVETEVAYASPNLNITYTPTVSGAACWCDWEFNGNSNNSGQARTESVSDDSFDGPSRYYNDSTMYVYAHSYKWLEGIGTKGSWTAAIRCTVPKLAEAIIITFGSKDGGLIGLIAGENPETEMRLVQTTNASGNYNSHYITNATMNVVNATSAHHVYVFSVENNQRVRVYCDGEPVLDKNFDSQFSIGGGFQIGSVLSGIGSTGMKRFWYGGTTADDGIAALSDAEQQAAQIDCLRLYDGVLGDNAIAALTKEFPAVKLFTATVPENYDGTWENISWSTAWDGGNAYSKVILTVEGDATIELPDSITLQECEFNIASGATLTLTGDCVANVTNPIVVNGGKLDHGGNLTGVAFSGTGSVVYYWTGEGADTNWTTPANWGLASGYPGSSGAANSQNTDNVLVPSAATITLTGNAYLTGVTLSGNLTLTGGGTLYARTISGSKVILSGATLRAYQNGKTIDANSLIVSSDVEIADGTENGFYMGRSSDNNYSTKFELAGALTGAGKVTVTISRSDYQGITMSGDASQFTGEWVVSGSGDATQFFAATQVSGTASYTFNSRNNGASGSYPFNLSGGSFAVGALNGTIYSCGGSNRAHGMTITVGGRNEDCSFGGSIGYASSYCNNLVKTGTADMTYTGIGFYGSMTIQNGTYIIGSTDANPGTIIFQGGALSVAEGITVDPSSHFSSDSTAAVVFDDRGYNNEWATALTAANTPYGLTKKGAGTLTLSAATATIGGATTVSEGILVVPVGTTFNGAVTVAEGAKIQFVADPTWADGATPIICTFTTAPSADTLSRIEITGFGGRQSATLEYNSGTGAYVATVASPTLVWNGADGANWGDADAWLVGGEATTYMSGDKVSFTDASFTGETTELTVNVGADVDPSLVTIAPGTGHTYKFTGTGKVTTADLVVAATGAGTLKLAADVFSGVAIENAGTLEVDESGSGVSIGAVTGSGKIKATSGALHTKGTISSTTSMSIAQGATVYVESTPGDFRTANDALKVTGAGKLVICDGATFVTAKNNSLSGFTGELRLASGGQYNTPNSTRDKVTGSGKLTLAGGTLNGSFGGSVVSQDTTLANTSLELENGTTSSVSAGNVRLIYAGSITGGGTLNATGKAFSLQSSASSAFTGAVNFGTASYPLQHGIYSVGAGSENADYSFTGANVDGVGGVISVSGTTAEAPVKLGSLAIASGTTVQNVNDGTYVEVGKNDNSTLAGTISGQTMTITKVGATSTLTLGGSFSMVSGSTIDVKEGALVTQGTGNPAALTLSGQTLTVGANATATAQADLVLDGGTLNVNGTVNIGNSTVPLWLKADNSAVINVNAGGNLNLCRVTANGDYTMNFDGGTLTEYGAGWRNEYLLGGADADDASATITLNVKAGGLTVDTATDTTITPVLAGDAESTGGGLTKKGVGTLTLAAAPTFTGAITVEGGSVVVPLTAEVTLGGETYVSASTETTKTLSKHGAYSANVDANKADVPYSWVKSNVDGFNGMTEEQIVAALAADSATPQANGYNYFTCYALGLNPADADDKPLVSVSVDADGNFVVTLTDKDGNVLDTASNVTVTPSFYKYNPSTGTYSASPISSTIAPADVVGEDNVGYIRAKIDVSAE